jgi:hypothetical protein
LHSIVIEENRVRSERGREWQDGMQRGRANLQRIPSVAGSAGMQRSSSKTLLRSDSPAPERDLPETSSQRVEGTTGVYRGEFSNLSSDPSAPMVKPRGGFFEDEPKLLRARTTVGKRATALDWSVTGWEESGESNIKIAGDFDKFVSSRWHKVQVQMLSKNRRPSTSPNAYVGPRENHGSIPSRPSDLAARNPTPLGLPKRRSKPPRSLRIDKPKAAPISKPDPSAGLETPIEQRETVESPEVNVDQDVGIFASEEALHVDTPDERSDDDEENDGFEEKGSVRSASEDEVVDGTQGRKHLAGVRTDHLFEVIDSSDDGGD